MREELIILGIDPGLAHTGWGVISCLGSNEKPIAYGCITTPSTQSDAQRLCHIHDEVLKVIDTYKPSELGIEQIYFGVNAKSAFATGQARGAALVAAGKQGLIVGEYSPPQIKQAIVGTGSAEKEQIQYMVKSILGLDHIPSPDHAADALAAALTHAHLRGVKIR